MRYGNPYREQRLSDKKQGIQPSAPTGKLNPLFRALNNKTRDIGFLVLTSHHAAWSRTSSTGTLIIHVLGLFHVGAHGRTNVAPTRTSIYLILEC